MISHQGNFSLSLSLLQRLLVSYAFQESGSCYLFDCGQPVDIKCKFNTHSHYTSAVLRVNRHQLELSLWSEQSQHEAELANLRFVGEGGRLQVVLLMAPGVRGVSTGVTVIPNGYSYLIH